MMPKKPASPPASTNRKTPDPPLTLRPLSFEEALTGLLQVAPPPKDDTPELAHEPPLQQSPRKRKPRQGEETESD